MLSLRCVRSSLLMLVVHVMFGVFPVSITATIVSWNENGPQNLSCDLGKACNFELTANGTLSDLIVRVNRFKTGSGHLVTHLKKKSSQNFLIVDMLTDKSLCTRTSTNTEWKTQGQKLMVNIATFTEADIGQYSVELLNNGANQWLNKTLYVSKAHPTTGGVDYLLIGTCIIAVAVSLYLIGVVITLCIIYYRICGGNRCRCTGPSPSSTEV